MLHQFNILGMVVITALALLAIPFPDGAIALGLVAVLSGAAIMIFRSSSEEKDFLTSLFLLGLVLRMGFGILIHVFELRDFFGGDAFSYDLLGSNIANSWSGYADASLPVGFAENSGAGWGMYNLVAVIYFLLGRNIFAAQCFCAVLGAATAPMVYHCSKMIFNNNKVAKIASIGVAVFPSFIIWSGQLLKDGLITLLLVTCMTMVLQIQKKFSWPSLAVLILSMFGVLSLRFYLFYMVAIAVAGSFLVGISESKRSILRNVAVLGVAAMALIYLGVGRQASVELTTFGNLQRIQSSRSDLARSANSGYNEEADVSTAEGALVAVPKGLTYLMLAPFPWQASNLRQAITVPEVLVWWGMIPFIILGTIYTVRNRLRTALPVLVFSFLLTMAYSVFQGNVGTAYRQRTQIQVFLFILMAAGWTVYKEQKENKRLIAAANQRRIFEQLRGPREDMRGPQAAGRI
jgi:hypothetical protein